MMSASVPQTTVASPAEAEGIGLHTGVPVRLRLLPTGADDGIYFIRTDLPGAPRVDANSDSVNREALQRRTELINPQGVPVGMAEHFLAACLGLGLDNVRVELNGPELPIFDGSVLTYVDVIRRAVIIPLERPRRHWTLNRPVTLIRDHAEIIAIPALHMELAFIAELRHAGLSNQSAALSLKPESFIKKLAPARTFCFYDEVERLRAAGLIRGGTEKCAIVIRDGKPLNGEYRLPNELACHKLIDLIGDLAVLGRPVHALITARGSGHAMNHAFIDLLRKELTEDA